MNYVRGWGLPLEKWVKWLLPYPLLLCIISKHQILLAVIWVQWDLPLWDLHWFKILSIKIPKNMYKIQCAKMVSLQLYQNFNMYLGELSAFHSLLFGLGGQWIHLDLASWLRITVKSLKAMIVGLQIRLFFFFFFSEWEKIYML